MSKSTITLLDEEKHSDLVPPPGAKNRIKCYYGVHIPLREHLGDWHMEGSLLGMSYTDIVIDSINSSDAGMDIAGHTVAQEVPCPCCTHLSSRIQSKYIRTLVDLPISGYKVRLTVHARRFWCTNPSCSRKIFVERLPILAIAHARKTTRFKDMLQAIGLELGGEAAARLGKQLRMECSPD